MNAAEELELEQRSQTAAVVATFVAVILLLIGTRLAISSRETVHWPTASATVIGAELSRSGNRQRFSWVPVIAYEYEVEGRRYASTKIVAGDIGSGRDQAHRLHKLYSVGTEVDVFYKPDQPAIAVLQPGQNGSGGGLTGTGWVFLLGGLGILVWLCGALWTWARRFTGEDGPPADKSPGEDRQGAALAEDPDPHDQVRTDDEVEEARRRLGFS